MKLGRLLVVLALAGCATAMYGGQSDELTQLDSCVGPPDPDYLSVRKQVSFAMAERGLPMSEVLTGLETSARLRATPGGSLSAQDSTFLVRNGFMGLYGGGAFSTERFAALRECMGQRYGMAIRVIEIHAP